MNRRKGKLKIQVRWRARRQFYLVPWRVVQSNIDGAVSDALSDLINKIRERLRVIED